MKSNSLSFLMLVALVAGNMIGSGIFFLPAVLARFGAVSLIAWCCTALGAFFLALVFITYARIYISVGGPYAYCRDAFGDFVGFQVAYSYWVALWVGNAAAVVALVSYISIFFPGLLMHASYQLAASLAIIWALTLINLFSITVTGYLQIITMLLKIIPLLILIFFGWPHIVWANFQWEASLKLHGHFSTLSEAVALTLWTFLGVESATIPAQHIEDPKEKIPKATLMGVFITIFLYLASIVVVIGCLSPKNLASSHAPYADVAAHIFGPYGFYLIGFGAIMAGLGSMNGMILLQGQMPYAASLDGLFPKIFSIKSRKNTPKIALIISAILISILLCLRMNDALIDKFTFIVKLAIFPTLIPYLFSSIGLLLFFKKPFTTSLICIAALAFLYSFWIVIGLGQETVYLGSLLFLSGLPIYACIKRNYI